MPKKYLTNTLIIEIVKQYGYPTEGGIKVSGVANIRYVANVGDTSAIIEASQLCNYSAVSVAIEESDNFEWKLESYQPI